MSELLKYSIPYMTYNIFIFKKYYLTCAENDLHKETEVDFFGNYGIKVYKSPS